MNVLIGLERSGIIREAFRRRGHRAYSCDLVPAEDGNENWHLQGDVRAWIAEPPFGEPWDLFIAHPVCTLLCNASVWAFTKTPPNPRPGVLYGEARYTAMIAAATFFRDLLHTDIPMVALENPVMHRYAKIIIGQDQTQSIQPYEFGEDASKRTCLWLKGLPKLTPTKRIPPRIINGRKLWANQTDSGQNKLGPRFDKDGNNLRAIDRARTYLGIANAMAEQWG